MRVPQLYAGPERLPAEGGVLDPRLGMATVLGECASCRQGFRDCPGHFGHIRLDEPLFHNGLFRRLLSVLQSLCFDCGRLLVALPARFRPPPRPRFMQQRAHFDTVVKRCRAAGVCAHCGAGKRALKRLATGVDKIVELGTPAGSAPRWPTEQVVGTVGEPPAAVSTRELTPRQVRDILRRLPLSDWRYLLLNATPPPPEDLLLVAVPVPPIQVRPPVQISIDRSNEDDLTIKLFELLRAKTDLAAMRSEGRPPARIEEQGALLQLAHNQLLNSDAAESKAPFSRLSAVQGLLQRLKGKPGRLRGNLQGKRVEHSARTVISPDPNLAVDEVGVPLRMAVQLTFPERVTDRNLRRLQQAVAIGPFAYLGATHLECETAVFEGQGTQTGRYFLGPTPARQRALTVLAPGMTVHRHLLPGDAVLFNRQPSLHRQSIMAFRVRITQTNTLSFNECVCAPFNADFDGDEMNLHVLQTVEARAEALGLLSSSRNLLSARNGEANIALIQDFYSALYLLSARECLLRTEEAAQLLLGAGLADARLPRPAVLRPRPLFSGKQVISALLLACGGAALPPLALKERYYRGGGAWDAGEGWVVVQGGQLCAGRVGKAALGGVRGSVMRTLIDRASQEQTAQLLAGLSRLCARLIERFGLSFSLRDVLTPPAVQTAKAALLERDRAVETRDEASTVSALNALREETSRRVMESLPARNNALLMALSGAKGSALNICQMSGMLGQQMVLGKRVPHGFVGRSLPHFARGEDSPAARGFVPSSFLSGLSPTEFFFHTMAGREGLIDTAVKTADTGYMQRRLMKVMEDLVVEYDLTVRSAEGRVVELIYGGDGFEGAAGEEEAFPLRLGQWVRGWSEPGEEEWGEFLAAERGQWDPCRALEVITAPQLPHHSFFLAQFWLALPSALRDNLSARAAFLFRALYRLGVQGAELVAVGRALAGKIAQPGEAVGALASASLGEPCTQMTLKTFHFAGIGSMDVTLGVPRINEIFNAADDIRTPVMEARVLPDAAAGEVRARIEAVSLAQNLRGLREELTAAGARIVFCFRAPVGREQLARLQAALGKKAEARLVGESEVEVAGAVFEGRRLMTRLDDIVVAGLRGVKRAVLVEEGGVSPRIFAEGQGLYDLLRVEGVDWRRTAMNSIQEMPRVLGIEAGRATLVKETRYAMQVYGIGIDGRHIELLADTMSYTGRMVGMNRHGIGKMKNSPVMLACFETVGQVLWEAAMFGTCDEMRGVSEKIVIGEEVGLGTGKCVVIES